MLGTINMAKHNRILEDQLNCPYCLIKHEEKPIRDRMWANDKTSMHLMCDCGQRIKVIENINGFIVMRKYIKKKDQVKRINNGK